MIGIVWWEIDESLFFSPCIVVNPRAGIAPNRALRCPMRRHMGTSSTTKGCISPAHYFNTVSSPDVSPGGRKAALLGRLLLEHGAGLPHTPKAVTYHEPRPSGCMISARRRGGSSGRAWLRHSCTRGWWMASLETNGGYTLPTMPATPPPRTQGDGRSATTGAAGWTRKRLSHSTPARIPRCARSRPSWGQRQCSFQRPMI